jgi:hypothetical protein
MPIGLPRITILTPSKNGARFLVEAIESVRRQNYPNLEHIVLDACSTDDTLELLARYPDVTVISEPDHGSHDALNKGLARATGEIIGELNTDDLYADGILAAVAELFAADATIDVVVGHSLIFQDDGHGGRRLSMAHTHPMDNGLWLPELTFGIPGICGCFFRRSVFAAGIKFQHEYFLAADRCLLIALKLAGARSVRVDRAAIWYRSHAGSATINPGMSNVMALSHEYCRMAAELMQKTGDQPQPHRIFAAWHAIEGGKLLVRHLGAGRFKEAAATLAELLRNPSLPSSLVYGLRLRRDVNKLIREDARRTRALLAAQGHDISA